MADPEVEDILRELSVPGANITALLQQYESDRYEELWRNDPRLHRVFAWKLISIDRTTRAIQLVRTGLITHPNDLELKYLNAHAMLRGQNVVQAKEYTADLIKAIDVDVKIRVDALSLMGKLSKSSCEQASDDKLPELAKVSAAQYELAHKNSDDAFPTINAATMWRVAGDADRARALAVEAIRRATEHRKRATGNNVYWLMATLGEAHLLLGDLPQATTWYRQAVNLASEHVGNVASMRRNVQLLHRVLKIPSEIMDLFRLGSVIAFAGHMLDHPNRVRDGQPARFPDDEWLEKALRAAIRDKLDSLKATVGYCSGASGSDILFAEELLERRGELHIVLPFDKNDFYCTSVDFGFDRLAHWRRRFDEILSRAHVHWSTEELYLGDDVLFQFVGTFCQGLAVTHAARLGVEPCALVVAEPSAPRLVGGAADFLAEWTRAGSRAYELIDLEQIRHQILPGTPVPPDDPGPPQRTWTKSPTEIRRVNKVMLFADVKGFSSLREEDVPACFAQLTEIVAHRIEQSNPGPDFCNTWGDGLFVVFSDVVHAAEFALGLLDTVEEVEWNTLGRQHEIKLRIGLHTGPVYPRNDPVLGRQNYFGRHVNLAARIEPKTAPGCVYASEQFAALLAVAPNHQYACEFVEVSELPKNAGKLPLYWLRRR